MAPEDENKILRKLLWLNHGCTSLYGDDGEMQCASCMIDFKRVPVEEIEQKFTRSWMDFIKQTITHPHPDLGG